MTLVEPSSHLLIYFLMWYYCFLMHECVSGSQPESLALYGVQAYIRVCGSCVSGYVRSQREIDLLQDCGVCIFAVTVALVQ